MIRNVYRNKKRISSLLKNISKFIVILSIIIMFINLLLWDTSNSKVSIFNKVGVAVVVSNSMEPILSVNDLIVTKKQASYSVGDIVVYRSNNELIIHRIVRIEQEKIVTKGDANDYEDKPINLNKVCGKLNFSIPNVGAIVSFFKSKYGIFSVITLVTCMFIYSCWDELKKMSKK